MRGSEGLARLRALWEKGKYALPVRGLGALLLLWPGGSGDGTAAVSSETSAEAALTAQQKEMERILRRIEGAGELHLMLTLESGGERTEIPGITASQPGILSLLSKLMRGSVTPVAARDVVEDWLIGERHT